MGCGNGLENKSSRDCQRRFIVTAFLLDPLPYFTDKRKKRCLNFFTAFLKFLPDPLEKMVVQVFIIIHLHICGAQILGGEGKFLLEAVKTHFHR